MVEQHLAEAAPLEQAHSALVAPLASQVVAVQAGDLGTRVQPELEPTAQAGQAGAGKGDTRAAAQSQPVPEVVQELTREQAGAGQVEQAQTQAMSSRRAATAVQAMSLL